MAIHKYPHWYIEKISELFKGEEELLSALKTGQGLKSTLKKVFENNPNIVPLERHQKLLKEVDILHTSY